jgi:Bacterial PH domain
LGCRRWGEVGFVADEAEGAVNAAEGSFVLKRGRGYRIAMGAWIGVWAALVVSFLVTAVREGNRVVVVITALMLVYGAVMGARVTRTRIEAEPETLVVRNPWRTHRLARGDIGGFSTGRYQRVGHETAYVDLRGGDSVRLAAVEQQFPLPGRGRALEPVLDRLENWRTGSPAARASDPSRTDPSNG